MSAAFRPRRSTSLVAAAFSCGALLSQQAMALTSLSDLPLYALQGVPPNIGLTIDDSGSMAWGAVPDAKVVFDTGLRWRSKSYNAMYYDPGIRYVAPPDENGVARSTSFTKAWINGFDTSKGYVDLSTNYSATRIYNPNGSMQTTQGVPADKAADYGILNLSNTNCDATAKDAFGAYTDNRCYTRVIVSATSGSGKIDLNGDGKFDSGDQDERQNFVNWYSFYRTRNLATVSAASLAFNKLDSSFRVAFQNLHTCAAFDTNCKDRAATTYDSRINVFEGTSRTTFFKWLQRSPASGGTPLLPALERTGEMFKTDRVWQNKIGDNTSGKYVCRGNYAILMTDGMWNSTWGTVGDADNTDKTLPDGTSYTARPPYSQKAASNQNLADIAFHYWSQDLRPDLGPSDALKYMPVKADEQVPPGAGGTTLTRYWNPKNDPATWQHMVTYTIGLGLSGTLGADWAGDMYKGAYPSFVNGTKAWPATAFDADGNVHDLWHAAINGRGRFYSAESPNDVVKAFEDIVKAIGERKGSAVAASLSSSRITAGTYVYAARFNTSDWSGTLSAYPVADGSGNGCPGPAGTICEASKWEAGEQLNSKNPGNRVIITNSDGAKPFRWASLSAGHQTALNLADNNGATRLDYLRGDRSLEGTTFRARGSLLGDIINASPAPLYIGPPRFFLPTETDYGSFKETHKSRRAMVYVGANDGMLHGFDALTGEERLAFVPNAAYPNLSKLTDPGYKHQPFVDGGMIGYDVKVNGAWRTYMFGGLGLGGKAIYALDVTDPDGFSEANAASIFKWEFTDAGLGYTYGKPKVARLNSGQTALVFGSGYVDGTAAAALYIVDVKDGSLIRRIPIPTADGPTTFSDNGLTGVTLADTDANGTTDAAYAGDLYGNLWKFDLAAASSASWDLAYSGGSGKLPMYVAKATDGTRQPITTEPALASHPSGNGLVVYFGTGKYLGAADISTTQLQSFYAVWNRATSHSTNLTRANLLRQKVLEDDTTTFTNRNARVTTDDPIKWHEGSGLPASGSHMGWYLDFSTESGERVHQSPFVRGDRVIFITVTPSTDPCSAGGDSWIYELNAMSGSRLATTPFDYNRDNKLTSSDFPVLNGKSVPGSAIRIKGEGAGVGYLDKESVVRKPDGTEGKVVSTSSGSLTMEGESAPFSSWRSWREPPRR